MDEQNVTNRALIEIAFDRAGLEKAKAGLREASDEAVKAAQTVDASYQRMGGTTAMSTKQTKEGIQTTLRQTEVLRNSSGEMKKVVSEQTFMNDALLSTQEATVKVTGSTKELTSANKSSSKSYAELAARAIATIPIWFAIRTVMNFVLSTVRDIIKAFADLDAGMRKVMAVATYTARTQHQVYADLERQAISYYRTSTVAMKDITEAMYQLGTAGRSTEEMMAGFDDILNLAIGTFGDVATAGKTVSGIMNVFENQLKRVGNTSEQVQYVTDLLADAWKSNQIELSEMAQAMSYLGSVGGALNMPLEQLLASASVMSDAMLRGGKGGRLLARAFTEISKESSKLREFGVIFDPNAPLNYLDVMRQLHDIYLEQGGSMTFLNNLIGIFGSEGGRAVMSVLTMWEKFNKEISKTPEQIDGTARKLKELAEGKWSDVISLLWRKLWADNITTADSFKQSIIDSLIAPAIEAENYFKELSDYVELVGENLNLDAIKARELVAALAQMGQIETAKKVAIVYKIDFEDALKYGKELIAKQEDSRTKWGKMFEGIVNDMQNMLAWTGIPGPKAMSFVEKKLTGEAKAKESTQDVDIIKQINAEMVKLNEFQRAYYEALKKATEERAKEEELVKGANNVTDEARSKLEALAKERADFTDETKWSNEELLKLAQSIGFDKDKVQNLEIFRKTLNEITRTMRANLGIQEQVTAELLNQEILETQKLKNASKYNMMRADGIREDIVLKSELEDMIDLYNQGFMSSKEFKNLPIEEQQKRLINKEDVYSQNLESLKQYHDYSKDILPIYSKLLDYTVSLKKYDGELTELQIEKLNYENQISAAKATGIYNAEELIQYEMQLVAASKEVYQGDEQRIKLLELQNKLVEEQIKKIAEYYSELKGIFSDAIEELLKGETNFGDFFANVGQGIRDSLIKNMAVNLADVIVVEGGLGDVFAQMGLSIENVIRGKRGLSGVIESSFNTGAKRTHDAIVSGFSTGVAMIKTGGTGTGSSFGVSGGGLGGGFGSLVGDVMQTPLFGARGGVGGSATTSYGIKVPRTYTPGGVTVGGAAMGGMLGYSQYQSAQAGGIPKGQAIASGVLVGGGGLALMGGVGMAGVGSAMAGAAFSGAGILGGISAGLAAIGPAGWVALGAMALGLALGVFGKKSASQTTVSEKTSESTVASRIDVSNNKLELINRNLVALRNTMETYILPQSAYFSEKTNLEDDFSLSARRG